MVMALTLVGAVGCATKTSHRVQHFDALPPARIDTSDLMPVKSRATTDLLRKANLSFQEANAAQEKGDVEAALRHYQEMLQFLVEADLDPVIFYNLRNEFAKILGEATPDADLFGPDGVGLDLFRQQMVMNDLPIPVPYPERVLREIEEIQEVYPRGFQAGLDRSFLYAPHIRREFARAGLPQDLVWLAMVESQFKNTATSTASAVGMWQFMRATGQRFGLEINEYVDERRNWEKATVAAAAYLGELHKMFNEWPLAVSAYNMGEGGMQRTVVAAGGEKSLWAILEGPAGSSHMREETRKFYSRLAASVIVASNPERFGFTVNPLPPLQTTRIPVNGCYALSKLDQAAGLEAGTLQELNRDLIRGVTPPGRTHMMAVPPETADRITEALKGMQEDTAPRVQVASRPSSSSSSQSGGGGSTSYTVRRGDTISGIASRYGVSESALMKANKIRSARQLLAGKRIVIPGGRVVSDQSGINPGESRTYTVKRGDTLGGIATRYKVSIADLEKWNGLSRKKPLYANQSIKVSAPVSNSGSSGNAAPSAETVKRIHVVRSGESPGLIAQKYGVSLSNLLSWNNLKSNSVIRVNDKLVIHLPEGTSAGSDASEEPVKVASAPAPAASAEAKTHTAKAGESASVIAAAHKIKLSDFIAWNGLDNKAVIQAGKTYKVSAGGSAPAKKETASSSPESAPASSGQRHKVASGESAWIIAQKHKVSLDNLLAWNGWSKNVVLKVGQEYVVQAGGAPAAQTAKEEPVVHKVASGENPTLIAKRYGVSVGDLFSWNNWNKNHMLRVGDEVAIRK
jgi:membrane-bound lytic murein transglycosylase D